MGTMTMTNNEEMTIFDEIVSCGILEEDSVINFGAGHQEGRFLQTLIDYNGTLLEDSIVAVEPNNSKVKTLKKNLKNQKILYVESSLQDYIDTEPPLKDWVVITGIFDNNLYGNQQYDFVTSVIQSSIEFSNKGVIFTIKENVSDDFKYSMLYFFTDFVNSYNKFTVKKHGDDNYVFCIFKQ